jgi:hypothetical protein
MSQVPSPAPEGRFGLFGPDGLIRKLLAGMWESLSGLSIDFAKGVEIIMAIYKLLDLPDVQDEAACRVWCRNAVALGDLVDDLTDTTVDDQAVQFLAGVVNDNEKWALAWQVWEMVTSGVEEEDLPKSSAVVDAGDKLGIDPATIIAIVTAILELIKWFRDRKSG